MRMVKTMRLTADNHSPDLTRIQRGINMSRLEEFAKKADPEGKTGVKSFASGSKAVDNTEAKQAHPSIMKKLGKIAMDVVPYVTAAVTYAGMMLAGNATGTDMMTAHLGASAAAFMTGLGTEMAVANKLAKKQGR